MKSLAILFFATFASLASATQVNTVEIHGPTYVDYLLGTCPALGQTVWTGQPNQGESGYQMCDRLYRECK